MPGEVFSALRPPAPVLSGGSRITVRSSPRHAHESTSPAARHPPCAYIMNPGTYPRRPKPWFSTNSNPVVSPSDHGSCAAVLRQSSGRGRKRGTNAHTPTSSPRRSCALARERESAGTRSPQCTGALADCVSRGQQRHCRLVLQGVLGSGLRRNDVYSEQSTPTSRCAAPARRSWVTSMRRPSPSPLTCPTRVAWLAGLPLPNACAIQRPADLTFGLSGLNP
jgi:hypothetical protein